MPWFGESWGAPMCEPDDHVETPVGQDCLWCGEIIAEGEQGIKYYGGESAAHAECMLRQTLGSVGHIKGECHCIKGADGWEDPPGMTYREAAREAVKVFEEKYSAGSLGPPWYWERE